MNDTKQLRITPYRIYIIGRISGLDAEQVRQNFERIERKLFSLGYQPINPLKLGIPMSWDYIKAGVHTAKALSQCDGVFIQSNWQQSPGSKENIEQAQRMGKCLFWSEKKGMEELELLARDLYQREPY